MVCPPTSLSRKLVQVGPMITHTFKIAEAPAAYALLEQDPRQTMGVLLDYNADAKIVHPGEAAQA